MPNFIGLRARKFWVAVAARDAIEHVVHTGKWPNEHWNKARLQKCLLTVFGWNHEGADYPYLWQCLDKYISDEERADKFSLLAKLWPF